MVTQPTILLFSRDLRSVGKNSKIYRKIKKKKHNHNLSIFSKSETTICFNQTDANSSAQNQILWPFCSTFKVRNLSIFKKNLGKRKTETIHYFQSSLRSLIMLSTDLAKCGPGPERPKIGRPFYSDSFGFLPHSHRLPWQKICFQNFCCWLFWLLLFF